MNRKKTVLLSLLLLAVTLAPNVLAVLPTLNWTVTTQPSDWTDAEGAATYDNIGRTSPLEVDTTGRVAWSFLLIDDGAIRQDSQIRVYAASGALSESQAIRCANGVGGDTCHYDAVNWDRENDLWAIVSETHAEAGFTPQFNSDPPGDACSARNGPICSLLWNITDETSPQVTTRAEFRSIETYKINETAQGYLIKTPTDFVVVPSSFIGPSIAQLVVGGERIYSNKTGSIGWTTVVSAGVATMRRMDFSVPSVTHTASFGGDPIERAAFHVSHNTTASNELIYVYSRTVTPGIRYVKVQQDDLTPATPVTPTGARIWEGGSERDTVVWDMDTDEAGLLLVCGGYTNVEGRAYVAQFDLATNAQAWNFTIDLGTDTTAHSCQFDYLGGFYVELIYTEAGVQKSQLRRYEGGDFAVPAKPGTIVTPAAVTTSPAPFANTDAAIGFRNFCLLIGFESEAGKFFCGLVYVLSGTVLLAVVVRDLSRRAVLAITAATAFGLMIFVTVVELWPTYTTVIMIVLSAAVVTWAIRSQFIGRDD